MSETSEAVALEIAKGILYAQGKSFQTMTAARPSASPEEIIRAYQVAYKAAKGMNIDAADIPVVVGQR